MLQKILKYWNKPYPPFDSVENIFGLPALFGFFIFIFLLVFRPFKVYEGEQIPFFYIAGFGIVTFVVMILLSLVIHFIPGKLLDKNQWKLKHTLAVSILNIVLISIANYYYIKIAGVTTDPQPDIVTVLLYTLSIGIFPVVGYLIYSESKLLKENRKTAEKTTALIKEKFNKNAGSRTTDKIRIESQVQSDSFETETDNILFVKADGNYSSFYLKGNNGYSYKISRVAMKNVENVLQNFPCFIRCHRSYIVNINKVKGASGNARNISLILEDETVKVPVSRSNEKYVMNAIRNINVK